MSLDPISYKKTKELEAAKANKQQEEWVRPTLLNGHSRPSSAYPPIEFMKDEFGFVHLRGHSSGGDDDLVFILPEGYRPQHSSNLFPVANEYTNYSSTTQCNVKNNGEVIIYSHRRPSLNGVYFEAVN